MLGVVAIDVISTVFGLPLRQIGFAASFGSALLKPLV